MFSFQILFRHVYSLCYLIYDLVFSIIINVHPVLACEYCLKIDLKNPPSTNIGHSLVCCASSTKRPHTAKQISRAFTSNCDLRHRTRHKKCQPITAQWQQNCNKFVTSERARSAFRNYNFWRRSDKIPEDAGLKKNTPLRI